jgi:hypothetical protein
MGFVVYSKTDGEMLRYYDNRSKAQAQVTGHNRKAIMQALRGDEYSPDPKEWDLCEWSEYEQIYAQYYNSHKWHYLNKSSW